MAGQRCALWRFSRAGPWIDTQWFDATYQNDRIYITAFQPTPFEPFHAAVAVGDEQNRIGYVRSNQIERVGVSRLAATT